MVGADVTDRKNVVNQDETRWDIWSGNSNNKKEIKVKDVYKSKMKS